MPLAESGTYEFLVQATNTRDGTVTATTQQLTVPFTDVWQGPILFWGIIGTLAVIIILARSHIVAALDQLSPLRRYNTHFIAGGKDKPEYFPWRVDLAGLLGDVAVWTMVVGVALFAWTKIKP